MDEVLALFAPALKSPQRICRIFGPLVAAVAVYLWFVPHSESDMSGWITALIVFHVPALLLLFHGFRPLAAHPGVRALRERAPELTNFYVREVVNQADWVIRRDIMLVLKGGKLEMLPLLTYGTR